MPKPKRIVLVVLVTCALVATTLGAGAPVSAAQRFPKPLQRDLEAVVQRAATLGVPGTAVFVSVPGRGVFAQSTGYASLDPLEPVTQSTRFRVGSITKTFTATIVLQLVQEGKLRLDDTIERWVPYAPNATEVTVKNLLNMTSGIYDEGGFGSELSTTPPEQCWAPEAIVSLAAQQGPGAPRGTFYYSDTNYVILGLIVEQVTGTSFHDQLQTRIIDKLHLRDTIYPDDLCSLDVPPPAAKGYEVDIERVNGGDGPRWRRQPAPADSPSQLGPAGALISSARDLRVWIKALGTGALLNRRLERERLPTGAVITNFVPLGGVGVPATFELPARYGLGMAEAGGFLGHNGAVAPGFLADAWYDPATEATVVVLANATPASGGQLVPITDAMFTAIVGLLRNDGKSD